MASRCSSFSHIALGSTRVESTLVTLGQAAGTAAALCKKYGCLPRDIYNEHIVELQQQLLKDDQTIFGIANLDEDDKARTATVSVSHYSPVETVPTVTPSSFAISFNVTFFIVFTPLKHYTIFIIFSQSLNSI